MLFVIVGCTGATWLIGLPICGVAMLVAAVRAMRRSPRIARGDWILHLVLIVLFVVSLSTLSYIDTFFFDCRSLDFLPTKYSSCRSHFFAVLCKVLGLLLRRDVSGFKADFSYSCLWEFVCCFDFILNGEVDRLSTLLLVRFLRGLMVDD